MPGAGASGVGGRGLQVVALLVVLVALLWTAVAPAGPRTVAPAPVPLTAAEAVRGDWHDAQPPGTGWTPVAVPDDWSTRWPAFDGVVWYRLRWHEPDGGTPASRALLSEYLNMAGAVYLNGSLLARDRHLVEPLSRAWNLPRMWVLDAPLLRAGDNELLLRVSGKAAYAPGIGALTLGTPAQIQERYENLVFWRRSIQWLGFSLTLAMCLSHGLLWLLRRSETAFGWFAAHTLAWLCYGYNFLAVEAWPWSDTDTYQRLNVIALAFSLAFYMRFVLSFCQISSRLLQRHLLLPSALAVLALAVVPAGHALSLALKAGVQVSLGLYLVATAVVLRHGWRTRQPEVVVLGLSTLLPVLTAVHDTLVYLRVLPGQNYYTTAASSALLLGSSFALFWRFAQGMRVVENFNAVLQARVDEAQRRQAELLRQRHDEQLLQTRLNERLNLVRDLHDGLGMTLNSHLHALRRQPERGADAQALHALEQINDDLRLIIENSAMDADDALALRLAPLRYRSSQALEAAGIAARWELQGLDGCRFKGPRALDLLRLLQEALTNVLRHSQARHVTVRLAVQGPDLLLQVTDDGRGLAGGGAGSASGGLGLASMRARATRLGGMLDIVSGPGGTTLSLRCPVTAAAAAPPSPSPPPAAPSAAGPRG